MEMFLPDLVRALLIPLVGLIFVVALWKYANWRTPFDVRRELFAKNNVALLTQRVGLLSGQLIGMSAAFSNFNVDHPWVSAGWFALNSLWVFVAMLGAYDFVDWVVFPKIKNCELLLAGDVAVGIVEAAFYIGIGYLVKGSLTGGAATFWVSVLSTVVFYVLGLVVVMGVYWLHELVTPYGLRDKLKNGDLSAAFELAGILVGVSIVTKVGVAGTLYNWSDAFLWFFETVGAALVLLYALRWVFHRFFFRRNSIQLVQDLGSPSAAAFQAVMMVFAAFAVSAVMSVI